MYTMVSLMNMHDVFTWGNDMRRRSLLDEQEW